MELQICLDLMSTLIQAFKIIHHNLLATKLLTCCNAVKEKDDSLAVLSEC